MSFDACGLEAHKEKLRRLQDPVRKAIDARDLRNEKLYYTPELAEYFAREEGVNPRPNELKDEQDATGRFVRQANYFIKPITKEEAEKNHYIIYWAYGCNWSNRPVIARDILGLHDVIKDYVVGPTGLYGHGFPEEKDLKDPYTGVHFLSKLYKNADPNFVGRATTPTVADIDKKVAVSSDYHRITNHFEVAFRGLQPKDAPDLYPVKYRKEIDEFNDWLFPHVNNGHYRQAFTVNPEAYDEAQEDFHKALEKLDKRLETNRFVFGDYITDSDIRIYVSLTKWELGFYVNVGPQKKRIKEYKNIWEYIKELYNIPEFKRYTGIPKPEANPTIGSGYLGKIVANRNIDEWLKSDGKRKQLSADPENIYLKHPKNETVEDYITEVSVSKWNDKRQEVRGDWRFELSVDPSINPLKGLLKNE